MPSSTYFMSYSRSDEDAALRFAAGLRAADINVWVDQWDIRPSQHWDRAIEQAVRTCEGLLVLLSPASAASENVADEISFALENGKKVIPILLARCAVPLRVTRMQLIDATSSLDRAVEACVDEINGVTAKRRAGMGLAPSAGVDAAGVTRVKERLRPWVGPLADVLVSRASETARSEAELHAAVARHIVEPEARARFAALDVGAQALSQAPSSSLSGGAAEGVAAPDVERLARLLTTFLGPMSGAIARRESRRATSVADLEARLSDLIPNAADQGEFRRLISGPSSKR